ncbi:MAG: type II toxin-antitoxin system RelE/ParE family toxin [Hormoscilla sp. GM102CHS1]|nr:type II toxin-antitoxin system RelE/ParE family toxin [Hormoscilla sp. GM102CHS1]
MSHYILTAQAKQYLKEIKDYSAAARRFVQAFRQQCQLIARFPAMGRSYSQLAPALRVFPLENYIIFYRPAAKGIEVERLLSGYRDLEALFSEAEES